MAVRLLSRSLQLRVPVTGGVLFRKPRLHEKFSISITAVSHAEERKYSTGSVSLPKSARVVICGGGVIGVSVAYHLADRGWNDVVLLEQGTLTCGTTWHSAGLIGQVRDTMSYTKLMKYSRQLYIELEEKHGVGLYDGCGAPAGDAYSFLKPYLTPYVLGVYIDLTYYCWKQCGSLSLAQTKDRLIQLTRNHVIAKASDVESHLVTPSEIKTLCSRITTDDIVGGLWIPGDGALTAPDLVSALAKESKDRGVKILEGIKIEKIHTRNGRVSGVDTLQGPIECQVFINCAGQWARELGLKSNPPVNVPLQPMEHFYMVTTPVKGLEHMKPVIRDYDGWIYSREWSGGLLSGGFENEGKPAFLDGIPDKFEFQLLPEDWTHFQCILDPIMKRFPLMETAQIRQQLNGPESFTPDGNWNVGEAPNIKNYYVAAGMTAFGVAGAGGVGRHLSEQIIDGETTLDIPWVDIKRHSEYYNGQTFLRERVKEVIGRYRMMYPGQQWKSGRDLEVSSLHDKMKDAGACLGQDCAFEKALYFNTKSETPLDQYSSQSGTYGKPSWFDAVRDEYNACKQTLGLIDASSFSQVEIWSPDNEVHKYLQLLSSSEINRELDRATVTGMHNQHGGYGCHCLVVPVSSNRFFVCVPSAQKTRLMYWLRKHLDHTDSVQIKDVSSSYSKLILVGPYAKHLLRDVSSESIDQSFVKNSLKVTDIGLSSGVRVIGQTWCGEDGVLLLVPSQCSTQVYKRLMEAGKAHGIKNVGHLALKQLQAENFIPQWLHELGPKVTPLNAGLSENVHWSKNFIGHDAMSQQRDMGLSERLVQLAISHFLPDKRLWVWGGEPVYLKDVCVGSVSSCGYSFSSNTMYCLAYLQQTTDAHRSTEARIVDQDATYHISVSGDSYEAKITSVCPTL